MHGMTKLLKLCLYSDQFPDLPNLGAFAKLVHEELALQWSISSGPNREVALACAWFFLELMIKAMIEHLATTSRLGVSRKHRFSEQFHTDVVSMVASLTSDIVCRQKQDPEVFMITQITLLPPDFNDWFLFDL